MKLESSSRNFKRVTQSLNTLTMSSIGSLVAFITLLSLKCYSGMQGRNDKNAVKDGEIQKYLFWQEKDLADSCRTRMLAHKLDSRPSIASQD